MRMITGFLSPTAGKVTARRDRRPREAASRPSGVSATSPRRSPSIRRCGSREYVAFRAELCGVPRKETAARVDEALATCFVDDVAQQADREPLEGLPAAGRARRALVHRPEVLVLDEPTVGLDPRQIVKVRELIRSLRKDHTILLSTHILPEVELVCDRVADHRPGEDRRQRDPGDAPPGDVAARRASSSR